MSSTMARRMIGASYMHGRVGIFYAPCAGEGKHILQHYTSKSVDTIRGHSTELHTLLPSAQIVAGLLLREQRDCGTIPFAQASMTGTPHF
jgi:hypothetical protein